MILSPSEQYQQDLLSSEFHADPLQKQAIDRLDSIYHQLIHEAKERKSWKRFVRRKKSIVGCYLWGGVGTGKSYLMNTFFHCLPLKKKMRLHFHEFMHRVHSDLKSIQGQKNPLQIIARRWARDAYVLCFDELFVKDIADAMLLGNLLKALFYQGVCVIATSNVMPQDLYKRGLQRQRFMPAIKIILQNMQVLHVDNNVDYRRQHFKPAGVYFYPLGEDSERKMMQYFHYYAGEDISCHDPIEVNGREIATTRASRRLVWFDFEELCVTARSADDYLQIAQQFPIVMLSNIPVFSGERNNSAVRFINLIDVLYDQHTLFISSANSPIDALYQDKQWAFEFKRTKSRLLEMSHSPYIEECDVDEK